MIIHHPDDATLMSYAAGSLAEALSAVVATHISMCSVCAREVKALEVIGSGLIGELTPAPVGRRPRMPAKKDAADGDVIMSDGCVSDAGDVPVTLRHAAGHKLDQIAWKKLAPGVWHYPLPVVGASGGNLRLLKVAPGRRIPEHGHGGAELTLLLDGSYKDEMGLYQRGDVADHDQDVEHQPVANPDVGCICLIASDGKARFKNFAARIFQPLTGL